MPKIKGRLLSVVHGTADLQLRKFVALSNREVKSLTQGTWLVTTPASVSRNRYLASNSSS